MPQRVKAILVIVLFVGALAGIALEIREVSLRVAANEAQYPRECPDGEFMANFLRFKGSKRHRLDGSVRLYVWGSRAETMNEKHQTSLPVTRQTRLEWVVGAKPPAFRIFDEHGTRMVWQIQGKRAVCVQGQEFLAPDPYDK